MGNKKGKFQNQTPKKRKKKNSRNKLIVCLIAALILLAAAVALLLLGPKWSGMASDDPTEPQQQTESQAPEGNQDNPTEAPVSSGETEATDPKTETTAPTAPGDETVTVVDAYLKEVNGELHLIKVLSDGTVIDMGPVESGGDHETDVSYTVTFMNYDGTILKTETVKSGGNATPPTDPTREGYTFIGWSGSYSNVKADVTVVAQYRQNEPEVAYYTVKFVDYDGTVLRTQSVEEGQAATAPADPTREGYTFIGWDKEFAKVTSNLTVTAQYQENPSTDLTITVENKTVSRGKTVEVAVSLKNNPGIVGMTLKVTYDESAMTLIAVNQGDALDEMTFTTPKNLASGCNLPWDAEFVTPDAATNGEIVILTFKISDTAAPGNYLVSLSTVGDIVDNDLMPVFVVLKNGVVTVQ